MHLSCGCNPDKVEQVPAVIEAIVRKGRAGSRNYRFTRSFTIGRAEACDIQILEEDVSRKHARVDFKDGQWWIHDLGSSNGIWINGRQVADQVIADNSEIAFSPEGSAICFRLPETPARQADAPKQPESVAHYARHYFGDAEEQGIGERTRMVRQAFDGIRRKQRRTFFWVIAVSACICLLSGTYAVVKHLQLQQQKKLAKEIFYTMKSLELEFAEVLALARQSRDQQVKQTVARFKAKYQSLEENYDRFVDSLNIYGKSVSEKEKLILQMARAFGECEINMPGEFKKEVLNYIRKWQTTPRLANAVLRAQKHGYVPTIVGAMKRYDLPPEFFYLGLQESNFDVNACGPPTRFGIAKGMWQFIPATAREYGLNLGPLVNAPEPDRLDERHDFEKSTKAAASYLRHIYDTEAQASALLVVASYNWGQTRVNRLIQKMPERPEERNFWNLLKNNREKIPGQTYDYVFYIFSAAVIGQNPALFGFGFEDPLALAGS